MTTPPSSASRALRAGGIRASLLPAANHDDRAMTPGFERSIVHGMSEGGRASEPGSAGAAAACPWCSSAIPADAERCPSCGATVRVAEEPELPGVTAVDPRAIVWGARSSERGRRSKLLAWLTGETGSEAPTPVAPGALDPPPPDVRREMLRLAMEAELSDLSAEVGAMQADELLETGGRTEGGAPPAGPAAGDAAGP